MKQTLLIRFKLWLAKKIINLVNWILAPDYYMFNVPVNLNQMYLDSEKYESKRDQRENTAEA